MAKPQVEAGGACGAGVGHPHIFTSNSISFLGVIIQKYNTE